MPLGNQLNGLILNMVNDNIMQLVVHIWVSDGRAALEIMATVKHSENVSCTSFILCKQASKQAVLHQKENGLDTCTHYPAAQLSLSLNPITFGK